MTTKHEKAREGEGSRASQEFSKSTTTSRSPGQKKQAYDLPPALKPLEEDERWVIWKWAKRTDKSGRAKSTKVPYKPRRPNDYASVSNSATWGTHNEACRAVGRGRADGIGFCLLDSDIAAIDLDNCRDPKTGKIADWAWDLIDEADHPSRTYVEITPSGTGLRIIGLADGGEVHNARKDENGAGWECYRDTARYICVTGDSLKDNPNTLSKGINAVIDRLVAEKEASNMKSERKQEIDHRSDDMLTRLDDPLSAHSDDGRNRRLCFAIRGGRRLHPPHVGEGFVQGGDDPPHRLIAAC
jgi:primase-polymerase (primpol)-like protein